LIKKLIVAATAAALFVPAIAGAEGTTAPTQDKNAAAACKRIRTEMGAEAFKQAYGTNKNRANAFGKCVSKLAKAQDENTSEAKSACKTEQAAGPEAFADKWGTGKNKSNAFGKCVSASAKQANQADEQAQENAAKTCKKERAADPAAFTAKWGKNGNKRNAFGKCVSATAKQQQQEPPTQTQS
jgi:hypothetical protein